MTQPSNTAFTCEVEWKMWLLKVFAVIHLTGVCANSEPEPEYITQSPNKWLESTAVPEPVYKPPVPVLQLKSTRADVFSSEKVELNCIVKGSSDWTFTWKKDGKELHDGPDLSLSEYHSVLTITAKTEHAGEYTCTGQHKTKNVLTDTSNPIKVTVNDPPTPAVKQQTPWLDVFANEKVSLRCEVSSPDWTFTWYRNQELLQQDSVLTIDEKGTVLNITSVSQTHQGQYSCKAHLTSRGVSSEFSNSVDVKVYSSNPKPTVTRSSNFDTMYPGESINFECVSSESTGWDYVWYHNGSEIPAPRNGIYNIARVDHPNSGEYKCKAKRGSVPFYTEASDTISLQVSDPPTPAMKQLTPWLGVFANEKVSLSCEVSSPDWTFTWYRNQELLQQDSVLTINGQGTVLNITSVSQTHQGQYSCKAHLTSRGVSSEFSNSAEIVVDTSNPKPTVTRSSNFETMYPGESINFECVSSESTGWDYVWYHDGSEIPAPRNGIYNIARVDHPNSGEYNCKAKRGSVPFYTEASDTISLQVSDPPTPAVKQLTPWLDVFANEKVSLSCEVSSPDWTFTWYRNQELLQQDSVLTINGQGTVFNITSVSQTHQGQYSCKAHLTSRGVSSEFSNSVEIEVYKNIPVPTLKKYPDFDPMYVGEIVNFTCQVDVSSGWNYQWYKDGHELSDTSGRISLHLDRFGGGEYSCKASRGATTSTGHSKKMQQNVHEIPVPLLKPVTQWRDVFPGESMNMSCEMPGSSEWTYTWRKDVEEIKSNKTASFIVDGHTLSIGRTSALHRGDYSCSGKLKGRFVTSNFSSELTLDVYDTTPRVTVMQTPEDNLMHTEDFVSFSCHINVSSGWDYIWYKDDHPVVTFGNNHNISSAVTTDTGSYKCQVKRGESSVFKSQESQAVILKIEERPQASITLQTGWSEAFSTDTLVLKCNVTDTDYKWNFTWFREGEEIDLPPSVDHSVTPQNDPEQGQYTCQGIRNERPFYSKGSVLFRTKNLLLKRRILLSISGCLFFGIIAVFLGCIFLRIFRKPADNDEQLEENDLFVSMKLKNSTAAPCPLVEYINDGSMKAVITDVDENETTPLPITSQDDQALMTDNQTSTENGGGLVSFKK